MTLTSLSFFIFVLATLVVYYICPLKFRWIVLLVASGVFYGIVCLKYMPFIVFTILTTWLGALWIERTAAKRKAIQKENKGNWSSEEKKAYKNKTVKIKRLELALVLVVNFGILAFLKYFNWLSGWIGDVTHLETPILSLFLPLGISFYTFQSMGYIIDVYWEKTPAQKNPAKFALFASFFPQIIQGPIAIYDDLANQLFEGHKLKYENIKYGAQLVLWGLFMKMVVADRAVVVLDSILPHHNELNGIWNIITILIYALQLYADFAGGINISRGVAQMLGINLAENFRRPFFSKTMSEFWRRWHISLSHWLKTYLFYPIAISKAFLKMGKWFQKHIKGSLGVHLGRVFPGCVATLITFFVIGIWHGANWKYGAFGIWNGVWIFLGMLLEPLLKSVTEKLKIRVESFSWRLFRIIRTCVMILLGFAFDIADDAADSMRMIIRCVTKPFSGSSFNLFSEESVPLQKVDWPILALGTILIFVVSLYQERSGKKVVETLDKQSIWFQWVVTIGLLMMVLLMGMYGPGIAAQEFVYMKF